MKFRYILIALGSLASLTGTAFAGKTYECTDIQKNVGPAGFPKMNYSYAGGIATVGSPNLPSTLFCTYPGQNIGPTTQRGTPFNYQCNQTAPDTVTCVRNGYPDKVYSCSSFEFDVSLAGFPKFHKVVPAGQIVMYLNGFFECNYPADFYGLDFRRKKPAAYPNCSLLNPSTIQCN